MQEEFSDIIGDIIYNLILMGGHANYCCIIEELVELKGEYHRITDSKFKSLLDELFQYEVYPNSDNDHLPDNKILAVRLNYKQAKMNSLLKDLLNKLVLDFRYVPLNVKEPVHKLLIHIPWDEHQDFVNKEFLKEVEQQSAYIEIILPVAPRLGEEIVIPFIKETGKFSRGYVHEVRHKISGKVQEIFYVVHPWNDYYYRWDKLVKRHEDESRRRKSLRKYKD